MSDMLLIVHRCLSNLKLKSKVYLVLVENWYLASGTFSIVLSKKKEVASLQNKAVRTA